MPDESPTNQQPEPTAKDGLKLFLGQASSLLAGLSAYTPLLEDLHTQFKQNQYPDWPTVLQATLLQTTAGSLLKLLPPPSPSQAPIDRRSIATLIRNLVDTHDAIAMLCRFENADEWNLHRDILGYYLSGRIERVGSGINPGKPSRNLGHARRWYLEKIMKSHLTRQEKDRLKKGESILYKSRGKRINEVHGDSSDFVGAVLADLSTYVHSIPPALWFQSLDHGFDDTPDNRLLLAVWLQIANVYLASSIRILLSATTQSATPEMAAYLKRHERAFRPNVP